MNLNLMEILPVYLVINSVDVKVVMYWLMNWALRERATDNSCVRNDDLRYHP